MNLKQLAALVRLRWQLSYNASRKLGAFNAVITVAFVVIMLMGSVSAFFLSMVGGMFWLEKVEPNMLMFIWDGIIVGFLFLWAIALLTEIQRSEILSLDRLLHLPLSLRGAFLMNYASSLVSLSILVFAPAMFGLCIALVKIHGPLALLNFLTTVAFLFMITTLTYQLRGWLTRLMLNKRTRGTVITLVTMSFIVLSQLPNAFNMYYQNRSRKAKGEHAEVHAQATEDLLVRLETGQVTATEYEQQLVEPNEKREVGKKERRKEFEQRATSFVTRLNAWIPFGWPAYSVRSLALGKSFPALLSSSAMFVIGSCSLWLAYGSTLRTYTLGNSSPRAKRKSATSQPKKPKDMAQDSIAWDVPGLSPRVSTIAMSGLRNFIRAPQTKMALIMPLVLTLVFGSVFLSGGLGKLPFEFRSFLGIGVVAMLMFALAGFSSNLFGMDRNGFRAWVVLPIERREILLGRNLSLFPLLLIMFAVMMLGVQIFAPMPLLHLLATAIQLPAVFLLVSIVGNYVSIFAPMAIASGGMNPASVKLVPMLIQMLAVFLSPVLFVPGALALGAELLLDRFAPAFGWLPLYLVLSAVELAFAIWLYRRILVTQGHLLQKRETKILAVVTSVRD